MELYHHGGGCCGVDHIANMPLWPKSTMGNDFPGDDSEHGYDDEVNENGRFPAESASSRLSRLIRVAKSTRDHGIIEIVLAQADRGKPRHDYNQQNTRWGRALRARGFKKVTKALNSNSGNILHVYHLVY